MAKDRKQSFAINAITREDIAVALNYYNSCIENAKRLGLRETKFESMAKLEPDDDRLTDEICNEYAQGLYEIDQELTEEEKIESCNKLDERILGKISATVF